MAADVPEQEKARLETLDEIDYLLNDVEDPMSDDEDLGAQDASKGEQEIDVLQITRDFLLDYKNLTA